MLRFNDLYVTPNGKKLGIDVEIEDSEYFSDLYIDAILVDTSCTFSELNGPSSKALVVYQSGSDEENNIKRYKEYIDVSDLGKQLFFVYVLVKGTTKAGTPCGTVAKSLLGVAYNKYLTYRLSSDALNNFKDCELPNEFIMQLLKLKAFEMAIKAGQYTLAIKYWKEFFEKKKYTPVASSCGCHG